MPDLRRMPRLLSVVHPQVAALDAAQTNHSPEVNVDLPEPVKIVVHDLQHAVRHHGTGMLDSAVLASL